MSMADFEPSMKRPRPDEDHNGLIGVHGDHDGGHEREMLRSFLTVLSKEQLTEMLLDIGVKNKMAYEDIMRVAGEDLANRKLFVRGISFASTNESLAAAFSEFGPVSEATIIIDKATGKSKGFGFVIFANAKSAFDALQQGSLSIDGRQVQFNLAALGRQDHGGNQGGGGMGAAAMGMGMAGGMGGGMAGAAGLQMGGAATGMGGMMGGGDLSQRKLFVRGLAFETDDFGLREAFEIYGPVEDAAVIRERDTKKSKGFGFVTFRSSGDAVKALQQPNKQIQGRMTVCNLAADRPGGGMGMGGGAFGRGAGGFAGGFGRGDMGVTPAAMGMMAAQVYNNQGFTGYGAYGGMQQMGQANAMGGYGDPNYGTYYGGPGTI